MFRYLKLILKRPKNGRRITKRVELVNIYNFKTNYIILGYKEVKSPSNVCIRLLYIDGFY